MPADVPAHWRAYFAVENTDATLDAATRVGAAMLRPPQDSPYGRSADISDPQGAVFSVIQPAQPQPAT